METEPTFTYNDRLRNNEDKLQNTYGKLLIELCKIKTLFIVNWRIGDNLKYVYRPSIVIDGLYTYFRDIYKSS